ncbi:PAS domain S-box protein [Noviherbaspirillum sedimenti]|uniref:histidine kinase n=2 Tax=Noviherbaspirillum sedimenti TaxID=2320865 RepID=A0A3A3G7U0_9BURK|nr:PAS domain S-box protein [Noviherbaspirillum sedimenti]RJG04577.1 PAS domain S-box protein [Noviherbaspirillum sedimenti]
MFGRFGPKQPWHWLLPILFVLLFVSTLLYLPWQAQQMEANERQEQLIADTLWVEQSIRFQLGRHEDSLRLIGSEIASGHLTGERLRERLATLVRNNKELQRIDWRDAGGAVAASTQGAASPRDLVSGHSGAAIELARASRTPRYSQPAAAAADTPVLMDYVVPIHLADRYLGSLVATYRLSGILDETVPWWFAQDNEITLADSDDRVLARRLSGGAGRSVYTHRRALDLPGATVILLTNSVKSAPKLLPNLLVGSVIVLSAGLLWSLVALWRDITRRLAAEGALRQQVAFRAAMENSLVTGLRARDLEGRVTYVNPAFCRMLGLATEDLVGKLPPMPYWAPEAMEDYQQRFAQVLAGTVTPQGFETIFQRANGERFPVLIFESPLVDDSGRQTGWMGSILDISDQKRIEDLNRQQQEKLQASARLASMGEIASTLAHELNQPLAAISSYTTGALNLLDNDARAAGGMDVAMLKQALEKAGAQAQRAGQIIRSVHAFAKKREPTREAVTIAVLVDSVLPLIELQARPLFVTIQTSIAPGLPPILADRILIEQVLLNLTRNAIESMQQTPPKERLLKIVAALDKSVQTQPNVVVSIIDCGHGIAPEVAARLFSPFFSTKAQGMGMGLNICRTAIEFHGGMLTHAYNPQGGTIFQFSLPALPASATY